MPTYRNDTNRRITFQDKAALEWAPGEVKKLEYFVPHEMLGLTMTDEEPYVLRGKTRGFGYTEFMVKPGEKFVWWLPYNMTVELSVYSTRGQVNMTVGDSEIPIAIDPKHTHVSRYPWDMSAYLTFELPEGQEEPLPVLVKCEPFAERGE